MSTIHDIHRFLLNTATGRYPLLAQTIEGHGPLEIPQQTDDSLFTFLARILVSQQLSTKAADTIWARLQASAEARSQTVWDLCAENQVALIRGTGISGSKCKALVKLVETISGGGLEETALRNSDEQDARAMITGLWGFGNWSADMAILFYLRFPDIWSESDVALKRGFQSLLPEKARNSTEREAGRFTPYRTYLALHVWRHLDDP